MELRLNSSSPSFSTVRRLLKSRVFARQEIRLSFDCMYFAFFSFFAFTLKKISRLLVKAAKLSLAQEIKKITSCIDQSSLTIM